MISNREEHQKETRRILIVKLRFRCPKLQFAFIIYVTTILCCIVCCFALLNYAEFHLSKKTFLITWQNSNICSTELWLDQNHNSTYKMSQQVLDRNLAKNLYISRKAKKFVKVCLTSKLSSANYPSIWRIIWQKIFKILFFAGIWYFHKNLLEHTVDEHHEHLW